MCSVMGQVQSKAEKAAGRWCRSQQTPGQACSGLCKGIPQCSPNPGAPSHAPTSCGNLRMRNSGGAKWMHWMAVTSIGDLFMGRIKPLTAIS